MADLRRLGKRGSYRLGRLGGPRPAPSAPPAPHYPSFASHHRGPAVLWLLACLAGVVIVAAGALAGWWFLPFLTGLAGGLAAHYGRWRLRVSLPAVMLIAAISRATAPSGSPRRTSHHRAPPQPAAAISMTAGSETRSRHCP